VAYFDRSDPLSVSQRNARKTSQKIGRKRTRWASKGGEGEQPVAQQPSRAPVTLPKLQFLERAKNDV
jgi:hypothetical protein